MIKPEDLVGEEWAEWYRLTPAQRWLESEKLWETYLALGGSLDPEPDTQSPFFEVLFPQYKKTSRTLNSSVSSIRRPKRKSRKRGLQSTRIGLRVIRRSGV
jgi:hypothetical protein